MSEVELWAGGSWKVKKWKVTSGREWKSMRQGARFTGGWIDGWKTTGPRGVGEQLEALDFSF